MADERNQRGKRSNEAPGAETADSPKRSTGETGFVPRPVDPEEARRREAAIASGAPRNVVELTSPIGHRLRVPPDESEPSKKPETSG